MKKLILFFTFLLFTTLGFAREETSSSSPEIFITGNIAYAYIEDFETPYSFWYRYRSKNQ